MLTQPDIRRHSHPLRRSGFTLIEILIVVAIIVALIAILVPSLGKANVAAKVAAAKSELGAIRQGLEQYYAECHMYPASTPPAVPAGWPAPGRGSAMLAEGLLGYLDFALDGAGPSNGDGVYGFRKQRSQASMGGGGILGPFMQTDPKVLKAISASEQVFIDPWGHEILYFRSQRPVADPARPAITTIFDTAANDDSYFANNDCTITFDATPINGSNPAAPGSAARFFPLFTAGNSNTYTPGGVTGADSYLIISAGPDGAYFTADDIVMGKN